MEEKKRKIYYEANMKYKQSEKGKEVQKKSVAKSQGKKFINEYASYEELLEYEKLIQARIKELKGN